MDLREFWDRFQSGGIEVAVGSGEPHKLLGCREAFLRVFERGLARPISLAVVPHEEVEQRSALPMSDEEAVEAARAATMRLEEKLGNEYHFYVGNEGCLHVVDLEDEPIRYFVRSWTVIRSPVTASLRVGNIVANRTKNAATRSTQLLSRNANSRDSSDSKPPRDLSRGMR